jgi:hypothetical protein
MTGYALDEEIWQSFGSVWDAAKQPPYVESSRRFERNRPNMVLSVCYLKITESDLRFARERTNSVDNL